MEAPDFWDDAEVSQKKMKELKSMKDDVATYASLKTEFEDIETLIEMGYEENDPEIIPEIQEMLDDGTIASITEKWLGDDMTKRIIPEDTQE